MSQLIATDQPIVVLGLGLSGMSAVRYFCRLGKTLVVMDTRANPPAKALEEINAMQEGSVSIRLLLGALDLDVLLNAKMIVVSPGISKDIAELKRAREVGVEVVGDVDVFLCAIRTQSQAKLIGVTGSNGKSTVVSLMGAVATQAGIKTLVAGNIGLPVLDLLSAQYNDTELFILELSSFQLETTRRANLDVACVLNISADHMDRYPSLAHYCQAKQRIYFGAKAIVYNTIDPLTIPPLIERIPRYGFSLARPVEENQTPVYVNSQTNMIMIDAKPIAPIDSIRLKGAHNVQNALASIACLHAAGVDLSSVGHALNAFEGLSHRCQWVAVKNQRVFINDSKATNIGSAQAAIQSMAQSHKRVLLIAGGDGKDADFTPLAKSILKHVSVVVLIGQDAEKIKQSITSADGIQTVDVSGCENMQEAVQSLWTIAGEGDCILLSPACASLDMYKNFEARGEQFISCVKAVIDE